VIGDARRIAFQRTGEPHHYRVILNGEDIGEVRRVRLSGAVRFIAYGRQTNSSGHGKGHWGWCADTAPESEYVTRREAVDDMRAIRELRHG
jgi:hypothetical protein